MFLIVLSSRVKNVFTTRKTSNKQKGIFLGLEIDRTLLLVIILLFYLLFKKIKIKSLYYLKELLRSKNIISCTVNYESECARGYFGRKIKVLLYLFFCPDTHFIYSILSYLISFFFFSLPVNKYQALVLYYYIFSFLLFFFISK